MQGAGQVFHDFHTHFTSGVLNKQLCSSQLKGARNASEAAGGLRAPWLGGGGQR